MFKWFTDLHTAQVPFSTSHRARASLCFSSLPAREPAMRTGGGGPRQHGPFWALFAVRARWRDRGAVIRTANCSPLTAGRASGQDGNVRARLPRAVKTVRVFGSAQCPCVTNGGVAVVGGLATLCVASVFRNVVIGCGLTCYCARCSGALSSSKLLLKHEAMLFKVLRPKRLCERAAAFRPFRPVPRSYYRSRPERAASSLPALAGGQHGNGHALARGQHDNGHALAGGQNDNGRLDSSAHGNKTIGGGSWPRQQWEHRANGSALGHNSSGNAGQMQCLTRVGQKR